MTSSGFCRPPGSSACFSWGTDMGWQHLGGPSAEPPDDEAPEDDEFDGPDDNEYAADLLADAAEDLWLRGRGY